MPAIGWQHKKTATGNRWQKQNLFMFFSSVYLTGSSSDGRDRDFLMPKGESGFGSEEFDDLVDGQGHVIGVLEGVIGIFDGIEFDDVVFGKLSG